MKKARRGTGSRKRSKRCTKSDKRDEKITERSSTQSGGGEDGGEQQEEDEEKKDEEEEDKEQPLIPFLGDLNKLLSCSRVLLDTFLGLEKEPSRVALFSQRSIGQEIDLNTAPTGRSSPQNATPSISTSPQPIGVGLSTSTNKISKSDTNGDVSATLPSTETSAPSEVTVPFPVPSSSSTPIDLNFMPKIMKECEPRPALAVLNKTIQAQQSVLRELQVDWEETKKVNERLVIQMEALKNSHREEISRVKRKHWCVVCENRANYYCCPDSSYCSRECQRIDWYSAHREYCERETA